MDRRDFGKAFVGGAAGAGIGLASAGGITGSAQAAPPAADSAFRVLPDLPVRRNDKIHSGAIITPRRVRSSRTR